MSERKVPFNEQLQAAVDACEETLRDIPEVEGVAFTFIYADGLTESEPSNVLIGPDDPIFLAKAGKQLTKLQRTVTAALQEKFTVAETVLSNLKAQIDEHIAKAKDQEGNQAEETPDQGDSDAGRPPETPAHPDVGHPDSG